MKYDFIQEGFENGEVSPRFQGRADSDIYKTAVKRMANCLPTQLGSFASRAGGRLTAQKAGGPVIHLPVQDGPYGDFQVEIGTGNVRMLDRLGRVLPWQKQYNFNTKAAYWPALDPAGEGMKVVAVAGDPIWVDFLEQRFYLNSPTPNASQPGIQTGTIPWNTGLPAGTDDSFVLTFKQGGDAVTVTITSLSGGGLTVQTAAAGARSIAFTPTDNFNIKFQLDATLNSPKTAVISDLVLIKNGVAVDDGGVLNIPANLQGTRHTSFWTQGTHAQMAPVGVGIVAGDTIVVNGVTFTAVAAAPTIHDFVVGATDDITVSNLCIAINAVAAACKMTAAVDPLRLGGARFFLTAIKPGTAGNALTVAQTGGHFTLFGATLAGGLAPYFYVVISGGTKVQALEWRGSSVADVNGAWRLMPAVFVAPIPTGDTTANPPQPAVVGLCAYQERLWMVDVAGGIYASAVGYYPVAPGSQSVAQFEFGNRSYPPTAQESLALALQAPHGVVRWLTSLRGLILGTSRKEMVFSMDVALAIDPATGQTFDILDHSSYGSAENVPAVDAEDKIVFAAPGRQQLRSAGIRLEMYGGFKAVDVGKMGEHLLRGRVRSMCFLRAPVPRLVVAFDDGTGAIGTMDSKGEMLAWSRFTLPTPLVGIFWVSSFDTDFGTELWVGTDRGETLRLSTLDSDPLGKSYQPAAGSGHVAFDTELFDPPTLDGWVRAPLYAVAGPPTHYWVTGLPAAFVGQTVYAFVADSRALTGSAVYSGVAAADGALAKLDLTAAGYMGTNTWADAGGARRAAEAFIGMKYAEHKVVTLPLEGGNPLGTSQGYVSRKPQLYVRLVNSYGPLVNGVRPEPAFGDGATWYQGRVTGDRRATELGPARADVVTIEMDNPLRMEISAIFGGAAMNSA